MAVNHYCAPEGNICTVSIVTNGQVLPCALGRGWDKGLRWTNTAKTRAWGRAQHSPHSGQWKPLGLVHSPSPKAIIAFDTKAKVSHCPKQAIQMWLTPWDCATGTKEAVILRKLMLLSLMWYNSSCYLRDPRENEQFIPHLKSKGSCEKRMWHSKVIY